MADWDGHTYVLLERLLFDLDSILGRCVGVSSTPGCPPQTAGAVTKAWQLGIDMAYELKAEQDRLVLAKVEYDRC